MKVGRNYLDPLMLAPLIVYAVGSIVFGSIYFAFKSTFYSLPRLEFVREMKKRDSNLDGLLDEEEFRNVFGIFDKNKDGKIDREEIINYFPIIKKYQETDFFGEN